MRLDLLYRNARSTLNGSFKFAATKTFVSNETLSCLQSLCAMQNVLYIYICMYYTCAVASGYTECVVYMIYIYTAHIYIYVIYVHISKHSVIIFNI